MMCSGCISKVSLTRSSIERTDQTSVLSDRPCSRNVDDDTVSSVDHVVRGIGKERRTFAGWGALVGGIGMGRELKAHLGCRAEGCIVKNVEILAHCTRSILWRDC